MTFYDDLAPEYHLLFANWDANVRRIDEGFYQPVLVGTKEHAGR